MSEKSYKKVRNLDHLKELAEDRSLEVTIQLNFGLRSSKNVCYNKEEDTWEIYNYIDDTEEILPTKDLEAETNIIKAISNSALFYWE